MPLSAARTAQPGDLRRPRTVVRDAPFGDSLTGEEVAAVLAYLKSLWGDDVRAYQASLR